MPKVLKIQLPLTGTTPALRAQWEALTNDGRPEPWQRLKGALESANAVGTQLRGALSTVWQKLGKTKEDRRARDGGAPLLHRGMTRYWDAAEEQFWEIVLADQPPQDSVRNRFIVCAVDIFDDITRHYDRIGVVRRTERNGGSTDDCQIRIVEEQRHRLWRGWQRQSEGDSDE